MVRLAFKKFSFSNGCVIFSRPCPFIRSKSVPNPNILFVVSDLHLQNPLKYSLLFANVFHKQFGAIGIFLAPFVFAVHCNVNITISALVGTLRQFRKGPNNISHPVRHQNLINFNPISITLTFLSTQYLEIYTKSH